MATNQEESTSKELGPYTTEYLELLELREQCEHGIADCVQKRAAAADRMALEADHKELEAEIELITTKEGRFRRRLATVTVEIDQYEYKHRLPSTSRDRMVRQYGPARSHDEDEESETGEGGKEPEQPKNKKKHWWSRNPKDPTN